MAGIDKIYGTLAQYDEFYAWCKAHLPAALPYFRERDGWLCGDDEDRPLTNFPVEIDRAIMWSEDSPPAWVLERIKFQYASHLEELYGNA